MVRKTTKNILLILGTFFCPLGYDLLFYKTMNWVGSYWGAVGIFYAISVSFFLIWFLLKDKQ